jgi:hypothetical protein
MPRDDFERMAFGDVWHEPIRWYVEPARGVQLPWVRREEFAAALQASDVSDALYGCSVMQFSEVK